KTCLALLLVGFLLSYLMPSRAAAQQPKPFSAARTVESDGPPRKLAPDLEEDVDRVTLDRRRDKSVGVIVQLRSATPLSEEGATEGMTGAERERVFADDAHVNALRAPVLRTRIEALNGRFKKSLATWGSSPPSCRCPRSVTWRATPKSLTSVPTA